MIASLPLKGQIHSNEKYQPIDYRPDDDQYAYICATYIKRKNQY